MAKEEGENGFSERKRLKRVALAKDIIVSDSRAKAEAALTPSNVVIKHHGKDILKKSQRKNRFLFSFPGLLAPLPAQGGKIGELKDLATKNPILYLHFPKGRLKLFGTILYPNNRYLTLQFPRGGKSVTCDDYFDNMIVFSEAWWIGTEDENPEEACLDFPNDFNEGQLVECDFKGGAGSTSLINKPAGMTYVEPQSPISEELEVDLSDSEKNLKDLIKATPVRHSQRTAGKSFNFADASSGDESVKSDADVSEGEGKKVEEVDSSITKYTSGKTENLCSVNLDIDNKGAVERGQFPEQNNAMSVSKSKRLPRNATTATTSKEGSGSNHGSLVQATISTLFKKVEEKAPRNPRKSPSPKVSGQKLQHPNSKRKNNEDEGPRKKAKVIKEKDIGGSITGKRKEVEIKDDEIEQFSSSSQDAEGSDEDWTT
ncbi:DNA-binding protein RHL1 isoform X1 [Quercus robur]|uniref:DNA-binding protein RHL1 isoform X1 n=1 Tax=Quercus robur TaxID=38942 RepID=UPI0021631175|nr:DNA-binding protein RHL1 isoform X1 [Quercus robur]